MSVSLREPIRIILMDFIRDALQTKPPMIPHPDRFNISINQLLALIGKCGVGKTEEEIEKIIAHNLSSLSLFAYWTKIYKSRKDYYKNKQNDLEVFARYLAKGIATPTFSGGVVTNDHSTGAKLNIPATEQKECICDKCIHLCKDRLHKRTECIFTLFEFEPIPAEKKEEKRFGDICPKCGYEKALHNCPECSNWLKPEPKPKDRIEFKFCSHGDEHTIDIAELTQRINERSRK